MDHWRRIPPTEQLEHPRRQLPASAARWTTAELARRIHIALGNLPGGRRIVIISHGGPIACAIAARTDGTVRQIAGLVPPVGSITRL